MQYCNTNDLSEGIDVNKTNESKECWYYLEKGFKSQSNVCQMDTLIY